ncbi:MAG: VOC family protein [Gemmatimonadota bacterium]|nr:VOC family protein [Gemmatimonadota bacterium]
MSENTRARAVGINHVALEVDDVEEALAFYGKLFDYELRGRSPGHAFLDLGDQFVALAERPGGPPDQGRHFGLVVDELGPVERAARDTGAEILASEGSLDLRDPWGNRIQVVEYGAVQFSKAEFVLRGMGLEHLEKSSVALEELAEKGLIPE